MEWINIKIESGKTVLFEKEAVRKNIAHLSPLPLI